MKGNAKLQSLWIHCFGLSDMVALEGKELSSSLTVTVSDNLEMAFEMANW